MDTDVNFGFNAIDSSSTQKILISNIRTEYSQNQGSLTASNPLPNDLRSLLIAAGNGGIYQEDRPGVLTSKSTVAKLHKTLPLMSAERGQKLYIADRGQVVHEVTDNTGTVNGTALTLTGASGKGINVNDWGVEITGGDSGVTVGTYTIASIAANSLTLSSSASSSSLSCSFRVVRLPKVYDPKAVTMAIMAASAGNLPVGCAAVALYRDRLVWAVKDNSRNEWFMSKSGDPLDYNYSAAASDKLRAVAGSSTDAGKVGDSMTCLIPGGDDYLIFGCANSIWRLRGDPADGGRIDNISRDIGILDLKSWCRMPSGEIVFLSQDGVYVMPPQGGKPEPMSEIQLPRDLKNIDTAVFSVFMEYDIQEKGIHIFLSSKNIDITNYHWWIDADSLGFFELEIPDDQRPTWIHRRNGEYSELNGVLLGGQDGYIRKFDPGSSTDDGTAFTSSVVFTPQRPTSQTDKSMIRRFLGILAKNSGNVTLNVYGEDQIHDLESSVVTGSSAAKKSITLSKDRNDIDIIRVRAGCHALELSSTNRWAWEIGEYEVDPDQGMHRNA